VQASAAATRQKRTITAAEKRRGEAEQKQMLEPMSHRPGWIGRWVLGAVAAAVLAGAALAQPVAPTDPVPVSATAASIGPVTGFPIPRFVSIKASEANARRGPSRSHRIDWVFQRRDLPMMVVAEHGHWRRVVDRDGAGGWMHYTLLSGVRTAIVEADMLPLYTRPDPQSLVRAHLERNVIVRLQECVPGWCRMEVDGYRGWADASTLWGVMPGEVFD